MRQIYEAKVEMLTQGDLAGGGKKIINFFRSNNELQEVSRGHSTIEIWEGPNNHKSEVNGERKSV